MVLHDDAAKAIVQATKKGSMKEATDEQLMLRAARGNLDALSHLVSRYQKLAWRTAYRFLGDSMESEDLAQEAFLKLLEAAPRYQPTASFRTYFYRILTHLCIDRTRKRQSVNIVDIPDVLDPSPSAVENLMEIERRAQVRSALDTLPPHQKAAVILRHYEGLSYAEIAQVLGVTAKAVERLISRARASLQHCLFNLLEK